MLGTRDIMDAGHMQPRAHLQRRAGPLRPRPAPGVLARPCPTARTGSDRRGGAEGVTGAYRERPARRRGGSDRRGGAEGVTGAYRE
jgi:hypothetical protein